MHCLQKKHHVELLRVKHARAPDALAHLVVAGGLRDGQQVGEGVLYQHHSQEHRVLDRVILHLKPRAGELCARR